jgi:hypothetical protein
LTPEQLATLLGGAGAPPDPAELRESVLARLRSGNGPSAPVSPLSSFFDEVDEPPEFAVALEDEDTGRPEPVRQDQPADPAPGAPVAGSATDHQGRLAAAVGACPACLGDDPGCAHCHGAGAPGWRLPELEQFTRFVVPAVRRVNEAIGEVFLPTARVDQEGRTP